MAGEAPVAILMGTQGCASRLDDPFRTWCGLGMPIRLTSWTEAGESPRPPTCPQCEAAMDAWMRQTLKEATASRFWPDDVPRDFMETTDDGA